MEYINKGKFKASSISISKYIKYLIQENYSLTEVLKETKSFGIPKDTIIRLYNLYN